MSTHHTRIRTIGGEATSTKFQSQDQRSIEWDYEDLHMHPCEEENDTLNV